MHVRIPLLGPTAPIRRDSGRNDLCGNGRRWAWRRGEDVAIEELRLAVRHDFSEVVARTDTEKAAGMLPLAWIGEGLCEHICCLVETGIVQDLRVSMG